MDILSSPLLLNLIANPVTPGRGKVDFKTALVKLGITSIFDIVEMPRADFAQRLNELNDDNSAQAYDNALVYATQLQWLYEHQSLSSTQAPPPRSKRDLESTYATTFEENWGSICAPDAIAAIDSPAAYLRALVLFARQVEANGKGSLAKVTLKERRPDLDELQIDQESTFSQRPLLSIIDTILRQHIATARPNQHINTLLSTHYYPYVLPYNVHHHQCCLGLPGTLHSLGELNYRISKRLPFDATACAKYGTVKAFNFDVQCLLSGLSPEQQQVLKSPALNGESLFRIHYNWPQPPDTQAKKGSPKKVADFLQCTGLNSTQLQALLAEGSFAPHASPSTAGQTLRAYGARYVNGDTSAASSGTGIAMTLDYPAGKAPNLKDTTEERFDRMQRMIRLQQWADIPFAELDTLIVSAMAHESQPNTTPPISHNTLRTLGIYRYLSQRYALTPLEFCALLHRMPVQASVKEQPLFDQVFNRTLFSKQPLPLDNKPFDAQTRQQLCAALELSDTPHSLQLLIEATPRPVHRDLTTFSSIYRQARIARLFGMTVLHCTQLAEIVGASLVTPTLRSEADTVDFLDILMQLDWVITWLKDSNSSVAQLRRQLLLEPVHESPALKRWGDLLLEQPDSTLTKQDLTSFIAQLLDGRTSTAHTTELRRHYTTAHENAFQTTGKWPASKHLILLAPDIATLLSLPIDTTSLDQLLLNPHWLDSAQPPTARVELSLGTLYLLQSLRSCCDTYGLAEDSLLEYFQHANAPLKEPPETLNTQLSQWLGWSEKELKVWADTLPSRTVTAMDQLDWIIRCRQACTVTGLSSQTLLDASELNTSSTFDAWKSLGEAVIAKHH
ncbi:Tc toxin subunit A [Pseudomonas sp. 15FMM2]|uniref:Tc toxin subunit A n=1 Tax=Pseudomonas imrae TaxID=2992837 RepID=A0ACC7PDR0_9PSED